MERLNTEYENKILRQIEKLPNFKKQNRELREIKIAQAKRIMRDCEYKLGFKSCKICQLQMNLWLS